ncbi:hypothetical protein [Virgibacillus kimchii]
MLGDINDRLERISERMKKKRKWEMQLSDYKAELSDVEKMISGLEDQLTDEMKDVKKLERIGFTNVFRAILGIKEEKLNKEKQEVVAVQLKLKEANKTKKEIVQAIQEVKNKLQDVVNIEKEYDSILLEKEKIITESKSFSARQLFEVIEKKGDIQAYIKELKEAIQAGEIVKMALADAVSSLEKAEGWGTFDMFGGGAIAGLVKHNHIDQAEEHIHVAQSKMRTFQKELLDLEGNSEVQVDISGLLKFADFFFDGIIADWLVQGKIKDSLEQAKNQEKNVNRIITDLKYQKDQNEKTLEGIKKERETLITRF